MLLSFQVVRNQFYAPKPNFKTPSVAPSVTMGNKTQLVYKLEKSQENNISKLAGFKTAIYRKLRLKRSEILILWV